MNTSILLPPLLRETAERYCHLMLRISGADPLEESRVRPVVVARAMVAQALLNDGFTGMSVAVILGVDHSSINHYKKIMDAILHSPGYDAERDIWRRFSRKI